jgi:sugar/nucleoside kinase (ribokinase family)
MSLDVYVYGMTVLSTIHRMANALPNADGYGEIAESYVCPGGEAMNAAMLLSGLGLSTALGGPHFGTQTREPLTHYAKRYSIDVSAIETDDGFEGVRDVVLVDSRHRTVLGWFGRYFSDSVQRWSEPSTTAIESARAVAIDPYFRESSERAAELATRAGKPYVTIDCAYDSALHANAAANVISREYRTQQYAGVPEDELFARYAAKSAGLTIFTSGRDAIRFVRGRGAVGTFSPFVVDAKSTLGAGDTFRAGIVYGIVRGFADADCVRFASGLAALLCTRLPIADNVPSLSEVEAFLSAQVA